jgi:hypothetical protein
MALRSNQDVPVFFCRYAFGSSSPLSSPDAHHQVEATFQADGLPLCSVAALGLGQHLIERHGLPSEPLYSDGRWTS